MRKFVTVTVGAAVLAIGGVACEDDTMDEPMDDTEEVEDMNDMEDDEM